MTQRDLEARIRELQDIEAIKQLMWNYTYSLDYGELEEVVDNFLDDAKFQVRMRAGEQTGMLVGIYDGKENIRGLYSSVLPQKHVYPAVAHIIANPVVTVEGDRAKGTFYLLISGAKGGAQGRYDTEFVRVGGEWKISSFRFTWNFVPEGLSVPEQPSES